MEICVEILVLKHPRKLMLAGSVPPSVLRAKRYLCCYMINELRRNIAILPPVASPCCDFPSSKHAPRFVFIFPLGECSTIMQTVSGLQSTLCAPFATHLLFFLVCVGPTYCVPGQLSLR